MNFVVFRLLPVRERVLSSRVLSWRIAGTKNMSKCKNTDVPKHIKYRESKAGQLPVPGVIDIQVVGTGAGGTPKAVMVNMSWFRYSTNCMVYTCTI